MGFFDDAIGGAVGGMFGGGIGAAAGSGSTKQLGNMLSPQVPIPPPPPEIDPRLKEIRDRQANQASQYKAEAPGLAQSRYSLAEDQARTDLGNKSADITKSANQRGLLYSGLKPAAEAEAAGQSAAGLAKTRAGINSDIQSRQEQLDQNAFQSGAKLQELEQARLDTMYQTAMSARREQLSQQSSPLGMIGGILKG